MNHSMLKNILSYLGAYKKYLFLCFFLVLCEVICEMFIPLLISQIIDIGIAQKDINFIFQKGLIMISLAVASIGFGVINTKFSATASQGLAANIRSALFNKIQTFSFTTIDKFSTASLTTRLTNDVSQIQNTALMFLRMLIRAPLMLICALIFAISRYTGSISYPILFLPASRAAKAVVPVPKNGSKTISPTKENILMSLRASSRGKGAGCFRVDSPFMSHICLNHCS